MTGGYLPDYPRVNPINEPQVSKNDPEYHSDYDEMESYSHTLRKCTSHIQMVTIMERNMTVMLAKSQIIAPMIITHPERREELLPKYS